MSRGGARPGAGRKAGTANKKTREIADQAAAAGTTPLQFMLDRMNDPATPMADRFEAAKAAAPYVHPKLSSIEAKIDAVVETVEAIEWEVVDAPQGSGS